MIKRLLFKTLFFLLRKDYHQPLSKEVTDSLLTKLATTQGLEKFPEYLSQCANTAKNQYLYSKDETLKGTIFAMISLRDQIIEKVPKKKKDLTQKEKNVIMSGRGY